MAVPALTATVIGNLTSDPEVKTTNSGRTVAKFAIAHTPRRLDQQTNTWVDGEPSYIDVELWGRPGEGAAQTLRKGDRAIIVGELRQDRWEAQDGTTRARVVLNGTEAGRSTLWDARNANNSGGFGGQPQSGGFGQSQGGFGQSQGGFGQPQSGGFNQPQGGGFAQQQASPFDAQQNVNQAFPNAQQGNEVPF